MQTFTEEKVATNEFYLEQCVNKTLPGTKGRRGKGNCIMNKMS